MVVVMTVVDCSTPKQSYWLLMQKVSELQDGEKMTKGKIYTSDQRDVRETGPCFVSYLSC